MGSSSRSFLSYTHHILKMRLLLSAALAVSAATVVLGQRPARIGPDGKPLLNRPVMEECQKRISHMQWGGHNYFLSWREPWHKFGDWDWFNGRNFCRERCMDLVSFENPTEFRMFEEVMIADNISSIYTSGRKCNFQGKGCEGAIFDPINVNGWFWTGAGNARLPPTNIDNKNTFWSHTGPGKKPQPDNFEGLQAGKLVSVSDPIGLTVEGLQEWHDDACHMRSKIVCEDSEALLQRALRENPGHVIP